MMPNAKMVGLANRAAGEGREQEAEGTVLPRSVSGLRRKLRCSVPGIGNVESDPVCKEQHREREKQSLLPRLREC